MNCSAEMLAAIKEAPTAHHGNDLSAKKYSWEVLWSPFLVLETYKAAPTTSIAYATKTIMSTIEKVIVWFIFTKLNDKNITI